MQSASHQPHTSSSVAVVNVAETPNEEFPSLTAAVQAPINGPVTFAMAVKGNLSLTKLKDSDKSKLNTLREQVRRYQPKLRTSGVVPLYFRVSRGPIGSLRRSLGTVLPCGSVINLSFFGRETLKIL